LHYYHSTEPPTFEEATNFGERFIDIDADEHNRTDDFIPRYPMYTNFALPSVTLCLDELSPKKALLC